MSGTQNTEDPLGAELRTLFADDRLDLRPAPEARASIVSGARRVRRRRNALGGGGGVVVVITLVAGGLLLNGRPSPEDASPAGEDAALAIESASSTTAPMSTPPSGDVQPDLLPDVGQEPLPGARSDPSSSPVTTGSASRETSGTIAMSGPVLGPDGYGPLKLGMSFSQAAATGALATTEDTSPPEDGCGSYRLAEGDGAIQEVVVSTDEGIVTFTAGGARTPEGVGVGSPAGAVEQAYPDVGGGSASYSAPTGTGASYIFYLADEQVDSIQLIAPTVPC